uniref:Uncharacterized protein n=1 Tax=Trichogramma kaykai TaxID=54128 RepID=A0ABD2WBS6_9HYME
MNKRKGSDPSNVKTGFYTTKISASHLSVNACRAPPSSRPVPEPLTLLVVVLQSPRRRRRRLSSRERDSKLYQHLGREESQPGQKQLTNIRSQYAHAFSYLTNVCIHRCVESSIYIGGAYIRAYAYVISYVSLVVDPLLSLIANILYRLTSYRSISCACACVQCSVICAKAKFTNKSSAHLVVKTC